MPKIRQFPRVVGLFCLSSIALASVLLDAQDRSWGRQFGTGRSDQATGVAFFGNDTGQSVYVVGDVIGTLPGQPSQGPADLNDKDGFVRRYDAAGTEGWTRQISSMDVKEDTATGVAANATGVYVVGWTGGTLPGQPKQAAPGQADAFVVKFDANGALQWTRQIGTYNGVVANAVGVDATGVYVAGNVNCCATPLVAAHRNGGADGFLRKYAPDGTELWTRQFGTGNSEQATAIFVDATGIYVAGTTGGDMTVTNRVGPARTIDGFFLKFNPDGDELLSRQWGAKLPGKPPGQDQAADEANAIVATPAGIFVGGRTTGVFAGQTKTGADGLWDGYVARFVGNNLNPGARVSPDDVDYAWVRQFGGADNDNVLGLAAGLTHLVVTGAADGPLPGQPYVGGQDAFYRVFDFTGNATETREFGNGINDVATAAAVDARGMYVVGFKNGNALGFPTPVGDADAFIMRILPPPLVPVPGPRPGPAPPRGRGVP